MKIRILLLVILIALCSCTENTPSSGPSGPTDLFSIEVTDTNGLPMSGLSVRVNNGMEMPFYGRAQTTIGYSLGTNAKVTLKIFDLENTAIDTLSDNEIKSEGIYRYSYNPFYNNENQVNYGGTNIFRYELIVKDAANDTLIHEDSKYMCLHLSGENEHSEIGYTDQNGEFTYNNELAFPHLIYDGELVKTDEDANEQGTIFLSESINIVLVDNATRATCSYRCLMDSRSSNHYKLVWDADNVSRNSSEIRKFTDEVSGSQNWRDIVTLTSFTAVVLDGKPVIQWITSSEISNSGWHLYRSGNNDINTAIQINPNLIPGCGTSTEITQYEYTDENNILPSNTYFYWLEAISYSGCTELFGPIEVYVESPLPVTLSSFTITFQDDVPLLQWTTQSEYLNAGWNVYRSLNENLSASIQLNPELIMGSGTCNLVTTYEFIDCHPFEYETTYYYWIESISYSYQAEQYGPVSLTIPADNGNDLPDIPVDSVVLGQNWPNPFN